MPPKTNSDRFDIFITMDTHPTPGTLRGAMITDHVSEAYSTE